MSNNLKNFKSENGKYVIPVTWEVCSYVVIDGVKNLQEALDVFNKYQDDIPLSTEPDYVDGSYKTSIEDEDELLGYQDNRRHIQDYTYFHNPNQIESEEK